MYDPRIGRWTAQDPAGFPAGDANRYRYAGNSPTNATDPWALQKLTAKNVGEGPQTGVRDDVFFAYWGVGLYLDDAGLAELKKKGGGYLVIHRKITWTFDELQGLERRRPPAKYTLEVWFLDPVPFKGGRPQVNPDFSKEGGGPRQMEHVPAGASVVGLLGSPLGRGALLAPPTFIAVNPVAISYISVFNTGLAVDAKKGNIRVDVDYQLFTGLPPAAVTGKFPNKDKAPQTWGLGYDQYRHNPWTDKDPNVGGKPLASGKLDGTMKWEKGKDTFESTSTGLTPGPQRLGRWPNVQVPGWVYKDKKWTRREEKKK
jgi:hypothetical protein